MVGSAFANVSDIDVVVLDIEGTVCPITFVHDVLFPYALNALSPYLDDHWDSPEFAPYRNAFPEACQQDRVAFTEHVHDLITRDVKAPYLKALQGLLWQKGYDTGELKGPIFHDVASFIVAAHEAGQKVLIYSSGSVPAQKLFFAHTAGQPANLTPYISGWFDTVNAGPKTDVKSYNNILLSYPEIQPARWLFLSDNINEVRAALSSGMRSLPVFRAGNAPLPAEDKLSGLALSDFSEKAADRAENCLAELVDVAIP